MQASRKKADVRPPSPKGYGGQAGKGGRAILAHLHCPPTAFHLSNKSMAENYDTFNYQP